MEHDSTVEGEDDEAEEEAAGAARVSIFCPSPALLLGVADEVKSSALGPYMADEPMGEVGEGGGGNVNSAGAEMTTTTTTTGSNSGLLMPPIVSASLPRTRTSWSTPRAAGAALFSQFVYGPRASSWRGGCPGLLPGLFRRRRAERHHRLRASLVQGGVHVIWACEEEARKKERVVGTNAPYRLLVGSL